MKIVISEYSSGFADSTYLLCNELIKQDEIDELVYLSDSNNNYFKKVDTRVKTVKLFDTFKTGNGMKKGTIAWAYNRISVSIKNALRRNQFIKINKPDVILVMATLSLIDKYFLGKMKKYTKVVMTVHDVIVPQKSLSWNMKSLKKTYDIADALVVHSEENKSQLINLFDIPANKISVIHHGIEIDYVKISREEACRVVGIISNKPTLLFYGGIRENKGLDTLLHALKGIDCQLVVAGNTLYGESFEKYQTIIDNNHIQSKCYIEFTSDEFREYLFQACDYIVLPYKEFFSQSGVFMQAIHYRKPVIVTDVSSFKSFVDKYEMGFVCRPNDVEELNACIKKALENLNNNVDYTIQLDRAAKENSWEASSRKYTQLFCSIKECINECKVG